MRSQAMAGLKLALLLVLVGVTSAALTVEQTIENGCTGDITVQCKTLSKNFDPQTLKPGEFTNLSVTSTLDDPTLTCSFISTAVAKLNSLKTREIWNYLNSGFTDSPWMSCTAGCTWKPQDDGIYYRAQDGSFKLFNVWDIQV